MRVYTTPTSYRWTYILVKNKQDTQQIPISVSTAALVVFFSFNKFKLVSLLVYPFAVTVTVLHSLQRFVYMLNLSQ